MVGFLEAHIDYIIDKMHINHAHVQEKEPIGKVLISEPYLAL